MYEYLCIILMLGTVYLSAEESKLALHPLDSQLFFCFSVMTKCVRSLLGLRFQFKCFFYMTPGLGPYFILDRLLAVQMPPFTSLPNIPNFWGLLSLVKENKKKLFTK